MKKNRSLLGAWLARWKYDPEPAPPAPPPPAPAAPPPDPTIILENDGFCPCCERKTRFIARNAWFRDHYVCSLCGCIPRERALMLCIDRFYPNWRQAVIHESSPVPRGATLRVSAGAPGYIGSQYFPNVTPGAIHEGFRCEDAEKMTFADESIDLHLTQDVMEHIFDPAAAFREFARTLRPGGMHIFTVPIVNKERPTEVCAVRKEDGTVEHLCKPEYHDNPAAPSEGSLVTRRWGYDICDFIQRESGLFTQMVWIDALEFGIRAEYIEVLITRKR